MFGFSSLTCNDCENLNKYDRNKYGEAYCPVYRDYVRLDSRTCRDFQPNFYVMTAYCLINKISYESEMMRTLINFRNFYMMNNQEGQNFLMEYEGIGPILARNLLVDMYKTDVARDMKEGYIDPILSFIKEERFDDAQSTYINMINNLKIRYGYEEKKEIEKQKRL